MKCCICGDKINGYGNDPWPLVKKKSARCCDKCNNKVLVERVYIAITHKDREIMKREAT